MKTVIIHYTDSDGDNRQHKIEFQNGATNFLLEFPQEQPSYTFTAMIGGVEHNCRTHDKTKVQVGDTVAVAYLGIPYFTTVKKLTPGDTSAYLSATVIKGL